ncbi:MAG: hypothetical protein ABSG53_11095 [Thermoguttaceae bacterium]
MKRREFKVVTFKAEASLVAALENLPNRSEFIRHAVFAALYANCPMCNGTGRTDSAQPPNVKQQQPQPHTPITSATALPKEPPLTN